MIELTPRAGPGDDVRTRTNAHPRRRTRKRVDTDAHARSRTVRHQVPHKDELRISCSYTLSAVLSAVAACRHLILATW